MDEPAEPAWLGEIATDAAQAFALRIVGDEAFAPAGSRLKRWVLQPLEP